MKQLDEFSMDLDLRLRLVCLWTSLATNAGCVENFGLLEPAHSFFGLFGEQGV